MHIQDFQTKLLQSKGWLSVIVGMLVQLDQLHLYDYVVTQRYQMYTFMGLEICLRTYYWCTFEKRENTDYPVFQQLISVMQDKQGFRDKTMKVKLLN